MSRTTNEKHASPSGAILPENPSLPRAQRENQPIDHRHGINYEPQALTAARAILRNDDPPEDVFLPEVFAGANDWPGFRTACAKALETRCHFIQIPCVGPYDECNALHDRLEQPTKNPRLRQYLIEEALREVFSLIAKLDQPDSDFTTDNMNLYHAFHGVLLDEMEALVTEWDRTLGGAS